MKQNYKKSVEILQSRYDYKYCELTHGTLNPPAHSSSKIFQIKNKMVKILIKKKINNLLSG